MVRVGDCGLTIEEAIAEAAASGDALGVRGIEVAVGTTGQCRAEPLVEAVYRELARDIDRIRLYVSGGLLGKSTRL